MARFGMGNKKSVIAFAITGYQLGIHNKVSRIVKGETSIADEVGNTLTQINQQPMALAPAAIGFWFWGKPYRGKL